MSKLGRFSRTELLLGEVGMEKLANSTVAIFGVGGVGSFVAEGLARAGVGHLVLIDNDLICLTNINRQIHATSKTVGKKKTETMKERILTSTRRLLSIRLRTSTCPSRPSASSRCLTTTLSMPSTR